MLVHDGPDDVPIPSRPFGFKTLKNAQAFGDLATLRAHDLPAEKLRLDGSQHPADAIDALTARVRGCSPRTETDLTLRRGVTRDPGLDGRRGQDDPSRGGAEPRTRQGA